MLNLVLLQSDIFVTTGLGNSEGIHVVWPSFSEQASSRSVLPLKIERGDFSRSLLKLF